EIKTNDGAVAILQAPATIQLINDNALHLHTGKLVGLCKTETSKGFTVRTDHADIIDLGTEFGVEVNGNQVTTTVFTGQVELATPGSKPQPLTQNQTAQLRINGINRRLTVKDQLAQGFDKLQAMSPTAALRNDPAMIAYYGFEADDLVDGKLLNRAAATLGKMDGILGQAGRADSKPALTQGRRPGTGALRFEAEEYDLVRIPAADAKAIDGLEQFTIGVWVKPDNMNQVSHHLLTKRLANEQSVLNFGLTWDITPVGGYLNNTVFLNRHSKGSKTTASFKADSLKRESRWLHIVVTFDHGERVLYKDGQLIERLPAFGPDRDAVFDAELLIGAASPHLDELGTYLDGDLDELFILGRVMSKQEVSAMYEAAMARPEVIPLPDEPR
ncbi:MAG: LamG-like jellyroll fold domain-containing protein, partial [Phycisphaeraceae bacterium]